MVAGRRTLAPMHQQLVDLVAQRGYGLSGAPCTKAPKTESAGARGRRPAAKRKLSFDQKRALEFAAERDRVAARRCTTLEARLGDVDLHGRDPAGFDATRAYADKRAELKRAEEEDIAGAEEILREELEAFAALA